MSSMSAVSSHVLCKSSGTFALGGGHLSGPGSQLQPGIKLKDVERCTKVLTYSTYDTYTLHAPQGSMAVGSESFDGY